MQREFKIAFDRNEDIIENYSQAGQDLFVLSCLNGKQNGTFLDLGCNHPVNINNTYLLEKMYHWSGLSIDIEKIHTDLYKELRKTPVLTEDCTKVDFDTILSFYNSAHIDYLSLDLEPASVTLMCLKNIPFDKVEFSIITFEHDSYRFGNVYRDESREIFKNNGYELLCADVICDGCIYEDWYYNPKYVNYENVQLLESHTKTWNTIVYNR